MNGEQQKARETAVTKLHDRIDKLDVTVTEAWQVEVESRQVADMDMEERLRTLIAQNHTHVLDLAKQQRAYVDQIVLYASNRAAQTQLEFLQLPWWKRYAWTLFGWRALAWIEAREAAARFKRAQE